MQKNYGQELDELEKEHAEEMKKEEELGFRRREQNTERSESRDFEEAGNTRSAIEQLSQESLLGGSEESSGCSQDGKDQHNPHAHLQIY